MRVIQGHVSPKLSGPTPPFMLPVCSHNMNEPSVAQVEVLQIRRVWLCETNRSDRKCTVLLQLYRGTQRCIMAKWFAGRKNRTDIALLIIWRHLVLDVSYKGNPHLRSIVSAKHIIGKVGLDLHLDLQ